MPHPFDPLTPSEIRRAADIIRKASPGAEFVFRAITLLEPPKKLMVEFLVLEHAGALSPTPPPRTATVQLFVSKELHEMTVDLDAEVIASDEALPGRHSFIDTTYMQTVAAACLAEESVQKEISRLKLPEGATVVVEPWAYATDGLHDTAERLTMAWFYARLSDHPDSNHYAYPLDFSAEVSSAVKITKIIRLPSGENDDPAALAQKEFDRRRIHTSEYHPDLAAERRMTTRPYHVSQPEGPSFAVDDGNLISWEKWTLRLGFNHREGMTLHDVRYDGRPLFYRLSLAEMFVPYADPRHPYPRKAAFDLGNDGAGVCANNLSLGCDCLGLIRYFDGWLATAEGEPLRMPNVVCLHEVDDGILWKHTNFRTGRAVVTRSRVLVLQTIITVTNYEYIFAFYLQQDAALFYEVRATGIMSTAPIDVGDSVSFGTVVAPGVMAPYHQHLFCLRIDPAVDGHRNSLVVEESVPMPYSPDKNPFGVGYTVRSEVVQRETGMDLDFASNRGFRIVNEGKVNPVTGTAVGFKLMPCYSRLLLAGDDSWHARRADYARHAVWVTRYREGELFPAGRFTMQSYGGEGISSWIEGRRRREEREHIARIAAGLSSDDDAAAATKPSTALSSVRDEDIVVWHTFGSTHNPRAEDWPVMPCEKMVVGLKPINFFTANPALDVQISTQERNRSVLVAAVGGGSGGGGQTGGAGDGSGGACASCSAAPASVSAPAHAPVADLTAAASVATSAPESQGDSSPGASTPASSAPAA